MRLHLSEITLSDITRDCRPSGARPLPSGQPGFGPPVGVLLGVIFLAATVNEFLAFELKSAQQS